jgi:hypothetical protein
MSNLHKIQFTEPWRSIEDSQTQQLNAELQCELSPGHLLFGERVCAVGRRQDRDDILFRFGEAPERYAVVHLTWRGKQEQSPKWPATVVFESLNEFLDRMLRDSAEFEISS